MPKYSTTHLSNPQRRTGGWVGCGRRKNFTTDDPHKNLQPSLGHQNHAVAQASLMLLQHHNSSHMPSLAKALRNPKLFGAAAEERARRPITFLTKISSGQGLVLASFLLCCMEPSHSPTTSYTSSKLPLDLSGSSYLVDGEKIRPRWR